jgi:hypothetical protein
MIETIISIYIIMMIYIIMYRNESATKALLDKATGEIVRIISIIHFGHETGHPPVNRSCSYASHSSGATTILKTLSIECYSINRSYDLNDNNNYVVSSRYPP